MATEEHKRLAAIIKNNHVHLRQQSKLVGPQLAWQAHRKDASRLEEYADAMHKLASIWECNSAKADQLAQSRIKWTVDYCRSYFFSEKIYLEKRQREQRLLQSWQEAVGPDDIYLEPPPESIRLLDVGSCFNPFASTPEFDVTAIDLCPATEDVLRGDLLAIDVVEMDEPRVTLEDGEVKHLPASYFECVVFSLLLEYIPSSEQRLACCRKAYSLLRPEGILIIITPDSQHVGKNAALMKSWRYALGTLGFMRVRFEKLPHITCLAFRKSAQPLVATRWSELHCENQITANIEIPQDENQ